MTVHITRQLCDALTVRFCWSPWLSCLISFRAVYSWQRHRPQRLETGGLVNIAASLGSSLMHLVHVERPPDLGLPAQREGCGLWSRQGCRQLYFPKGLLHGSLCPEST